MDWKSYTAALIVGTFCAGLPMAAQTGQSRSRQTQAKTGQTFSTRLSPVAMDVAMRANISGVGSVSAALSGNRLSISGTFEGLKSPAASARLYQGLATGVPGTAAFDLTVSHAVSGNISGEVELTPDQLEALKKGRFYVQIGSEKAPDGNLWGWLLSR